MRRASRGKRLELSPRDLEIFRLLSAYRYLPSTYIHAFVGGTSVTRFKERLGDLFHEGFLDRPERQWELPSARYVPAAYELGGRAKRVLDECGRPAAAPLTFLSAPAHRQFSHSLLICACLASFDLAARERPDLRFIAWPEILARAPDATQSSAIPFRIPLAGGRALIPDGMFGLEYRSSGGPLYRFFALEIDRGTMPIARAKAGQTSCFAKLAAYREIASRGLHKSHWGVSSLLVLTLTTDESRAKEMLRRLSGRPENWPTFLFKTVSGDVTHRPQPELLAEPWERAGLPPLHIEGE